MKAVILREAISAKDLTISDVPIPKAKPGWVLVKVRAFGINRSEIFTRKGQSPSVTLPRIIGIECVGEVADPSDSGLREGERIVSMMGGLGRDFDGSYAEYTLIPVSQVYSVETDLSWSELAAVPEMYYTAWCSLIDVLKVKSDETLLVRGGSSSLGLAAIQIASKLGATVAATTRHDYKSDLLRHYGADIVIIDDSTIYDEIAHEIPGGPDKILELIGTNTLLSSLSIVGIGGTVCMAGILGGNWELEGFAPMEAIPSGRYLTTYDSRNVSTISLAEMFYFLKENKIRPPIAQVFTLGEIAMAHELMESNSANGKIVVTTES